MKIQVVEPHQHVAVKTIKIHLWSNFIRVSLPPLLHRLRGGGVFDNNALFSLCVSSFLTIGQSQSRFFKCLRFLTNQTYCNCSNQWVGLSRLQIILGEILIFLSCSWKQNSSLISLIPEQIWGKPFFCKAACIDFNLNSIHPSLEKAKQSHLMPVNLQIAKVYDYTFYR